MSRLEDRVKELELQQQQPQQQPPENERKFECVCLKNMCRTNDVIARYHECLACGEKNCPHSDPMHYHHDGCPSCYAPD